MTKQIFSKDLQNNYTLLSSNVYIKKDIKIIIYYYNVKE